jgi:hypothetical protein
MISTDIRTCYDRLTDFFLKKKKTAPCLRKKYLFKFLGSRIHRKKGKNEKAQTLYIICEKLHKYVNKKNLCSRVPTEQQKNQLLQQPLA